MSGNFEHQMGLQHEPTAVAKAVFDETGAEWAKTQEILIAQCKHIVALRGAGANNGIDRKEADTLLQMQLIPRMQSYMNDGPVAVLFDGDGEDAQKPDIGYIMGRLRNTFATEAISSKITFVAAQKKSWYYPSQEHGNLTNANGNEYQTTVFPDGKFPGDHNSFTQSDTLANCASYEQWYVGASGPIASEQLSDLNMKVRESRRKVVMFRASVNDELSDIIEERLREAEQVGDATKEDKLRKIIEQRENRYGVHFDAEGRFSVDTQEYDNISFEIV